MENLTNKPTYNIVVLEDDSIFEIGRLIMKKTTLIFFIFTFSFSYLFAFDKISWGMNIKKIYKKVQIDKVYKTDFCEILYLPKNSTFKNEYDEYLLFSNDKLISRLQNPELSFIELNRKIKSGKNANEYIELDVRNSNSKEFTPVSFSREIKYVKPFPDQNSFEVMELLCGCFDSITINEYSVSLMDYERQGIINFNEKGYIHKIYSSYGSDSVDSPYKEFKYRNFKLENDDKIKSALKKNYDIAYSRFPGPFGIYWNMHILEMPLIADIEYKSVDFIRKEYSKYYTFYDRYFSTHIINPKLKSNFISSYTAIFDEHNELLQIVCVCDCYSFYIDDIRTLSTQFNNRFDDIETTISKIYGNGSIIQNRGERCVQWKDSKGQKTELIKNSFLNSQTSVYSYIYLIFSSPNYNETIDRVEDLSNKYNINIFKGK